MYNRSGWLSPRFAFTRRTTALPLLLISVLTVHILGTQRMSIVFPVLEMKRFVAMHERDLTYNADGNGGLRVSRVHPSSQFSDT